MIEHGILEHIGSDTRIEFAALPPRKWSVRTGRTRREAQALKQLRLNGGSCMKLSKRSLAFAIANNPTGAIRLELLIPPPAAH